MREYIWRRWGKNIRVSKYVFTRPSLCSHDIRNASGRSRRMSGESATAWEMRVMLFNAPNSLRRLAYNLFRPLIAPCESRSFLYLNGKNWENTGSLCNDSNDYIQLQNQEHFRYSTGNGASPLEFSWLQLPLQWSGSGRRRGTRHSSEYMKFLSTIWQRPCIWRLLNVQCSNRVPFQYKECSSRLRNVFLFDHRY